MTLTAHCLASGPGWRVVDVICTAGPHDRSEEEEHAHVSIAAVTAGTFQYRTSTGSAVMAPGALLLGNPGTCYRCGHDHGRGDQYNLHRSILLSSRDRHSEPGLCVRPR